MTPRYMGKELEAQIAAAVKLVTSAVSEDEY